MTVVEGGGRGEQMTFAAAVEKANLTFSNEEAGTITPEQLERLNEPGSFLEVASEVLGMDLEGDEMTYIAGLGDAGIEGMRAGMVRAVADGKRIQFQFSTTYDFSVTLSTYDDAFVINFGGPTREDFAARKRGPRS
jgi:hypothetical protein